MITDYEEHYQEAMRWEEEGHRAVESPDEGICCSNR